MKFFRFRKSSFRFSLFYIRPPPSPTTHRRSSQSWNYFESDKNPQSCDKGCHDNFHASYFPRQFSWLTLVVITWLIVLADQDMQSQPAWLLHQLGKSKHCFSLRKRFIQRPFAAGLMIFPGKFILWKFSEFWSKCATRKRLFSKLHHVQVCMVGLIEV